MADRQENGGRITIQNFYQYFSKRLKMRLAGGAEGLSKSISNPRAQKAGLALADFVECTNRERVQILGRTEILYLERLGAEARQSTLDAYFACDIACLVVTARNDTPTYLVEPADRFGTPLFITPQDSNQVIDQITHFLDAELAPRMSMHGNLLDTFGLGVLLIGESGVGKSECALDLVARGHRLVADDVVEIKLVENEVLWGSCPEDIRYLMELRGIGLIDIKDLFGVGSVRESKKIELVVKLEHWRQDVEYSRLGLREKNFDIFGIKLPYVIMPVAPGRNLAILVEVAARNQLLKLRGINVAKRVSRRLNGRLRREADKLRIKRLIKEGVGLFE